MGKIPVPKMKNGRNPIYGKKHTGSWGFWAGSMGEISGSQNEKWQGPLLRGKREEEKEIKRWGIGKKTGVVENPNTLVR